MALVLEDLADEAIRQLVAREIENAKAANKIMFVSVVLNVADQTLLAGGIVVLRGSGGGGGGARRARGG